MGKLDAPEALLIGYEAPITDSKTSRSSSLLAKCSMGKLDAPEALLIGYEAPIITDSQTSHCSSSLLAKCSIGKLDTPEAILESPITTERNPFVWALSKT